MHQILPLAGHGGDKARQALPAVAQRSVDTLHEAACAEGVEQIVYHQHGYHHPGPQPGIVDEPLHIAPHCVVAHEFVKLGRGYHEGERREQHHHDDVADAVANEGAHYRRQLYMLGARYVDAPPHLAGAGHKQVQRITPEDRHRQLHERALRTHASDLQPPAPPSDDVAQRGDTHHQYQQVVAHAAVHHLHYLPDLDLMEEPHYQQRRAGGRNQKLKPVAQIMPEGRSDFCRRCIHIT